MGLQQRVLLLWRVLALGLRRLLLLRLLLRLLLSLAVLLCCLLRCLHLLLLTRPCGRCRHLLRLLLCCWLLLLLHLFCFGGSSCRRLLRLRCVGADSSGSVWGGSSGWLVGFLSLDRSCCCCCLL